MNFLIGTAVSWVLTFVSTALTKALFGMRKVDKGEGKQVEELPTGPFIFIDVLINGIAGFLIGILSGYYLIGITWKAIYWPGEIALIVMSFIGSAFYG